MPAKKRARSDSESESYGRSPPPKSSKSSKKSHGSKDQGGTVPGGGQRDAEGNAFWEIADKRRVTVSQYKGKTMVSVREYYEKDEQMLPGKKGITMPLSQFGSLITTIPAIEEVLKQQNEQLPRPDYDGKVRKDIEKELNDLDVDMKPGPKVEKKRNFEETSDED